MDSRRFGYGRFTFSLTSRALLVAGFAFLVIWLFATTHLYATAVVLILLIIATVADMRQVIGRIARTAERDLERLIGDSSDLPLPAGRTPYSDIPIERAAAVLNAARAERQRQLEYLQSLLDTVTAALFVVGADGRITLANRAAHLLAAASVGRFEEISSFGATVGRQILALNPGTREILTLLDGQRVLVSVASFMNPGQGPQRLISLQRIAGELDAVELKAWQELAKVLAHEMMNSLTPIASLSESLEGLLRAQRPSDPARAAAIDAEVVGALEVIKRRSRGLMDFVERYRAIADLPQPRLQGIGLDTVLTGIDRLLSRSYADRGIALRMSIAPPAAAVRADPQMLEQAMINLLRNAADAVAAAERPQVEVRCRAQDANVMIEIADNGCGVPEDRRGQVFVPFFTTKPGGSGVGLNLARQIALAHGGQLAFCANEPQGSVFTLTIPAA